MSLRTTVRKFRLYYKSMAYLSTVLTDPGQAYLLPFARRTRVLETTVGIPVTIPPGAWNLLPTLCKLAQAGARTTVEADCKRIEIQGLTYYTGLPPKGEGVYFREIFVEDVYRLNALDLRGKTLVDIGAHIGDFTVMAARRGAQVHAFEPSSLHGGFLRRNVEVNGVADRVHFHNVGLSDRDARIAVDGDTINLVEGSAYVAAQLPAGVDFLKMDCEGCEYYLFKAPGLLEHLRPARLAMEYHRDSAPLVERLRDLGYVVEVTPPVGGCGYIYASREAAAGRDA